MPIEIGELMLTIKHDDRKRYVPGKLYRGFFSPADLNDTVPCENQSHFVPDEY